MLRKAHEGCTYVYVCVCVARIKTPARRSKVALLWCRTVFWVLVALLLPSLSTYSDPLLKQPHVPRPYKVSVGPARPIGPSCCSNSNRLAPPLWLVSTILIISFHSTIFPLSISSTPITPHYGGLLTADLLISADPALTRGSRLLCPVGGWSLLCSRPLQIKSFRAISSRDRRRSKSHPRAWCVYARARFLGIQRDLDFNLLDRPRWGGMVSRGKGWYGIY